MREHEIREILTVHENVAIVGMSTDPHKPGNQVPHYLARHGYRIFPVTKKVAEIDGLGTFPDLSSIPERVDIVNIFVRAEKVPEIVEQAIEIGAKVIWMQQGISHAEAAARAREAGLLVVQNACMRAMHRHIFNVQDW